MADAREIYDDGYEDQHRNLSEVRQSVDPPSVRTAEAVPELPSGEVGCASLEPTPKEGFVYFIETEDGQYVKIGYSHNPISRIGELGTIMPVRLIGCIPGSMAKEKELHRFFATDRVRGEWFRNTSSLRGFIDGLPLLKTELGIQPRRALTPEERKQRSRWREQFLPVPAVSTPPVLARPALKPKPPKEKLVKMRQRIERELRAAMEQALKSAPSGSDLMTIATGLYEERKLWLSAINKHAAVPRPWTPERIARILVKMWNASGWQVRF